MCKFCEKQYCKADDKYGEIFKLHKMLCDENIPHSFHRLYDGWQVAYCCNGSQIWDAIECEYSYGAEEDKLEIMGLLTPEEEKNNTVLGYLSADDVFNRIQNYLKGGGNI